MKAVSIGAELARTCAITTWSSSCSLTMILFEHIMQELHLNKGPEGALQLVRRPAGQQHACLAQTWPSSQASNKHTDWPTMSALAVHKWQPRGPQAPLRFPSCLRKLSQHRNILSVVLCGCGTWSPSTELRWKCFETNSEDDIWSLGRWGDRTMKNVT
jgi:hypothetical protein